MSEEQGKYNLDRIKLENAALRKYAAIQKSAEDKIGVQKIYVDITGDIEAAFVLDEIIFFTLPRGNGKSALRCWKEGYLWLAVQRSEWWERKRLTARQADTAIEKLEKQNLIFKSIHKFNGQTATHLRLNSPEFFRRYAEELDKQNPPENEEDTLSKDINDLYEMMGMGSELQNGELQNGETESPKCETELQIRDSINNPHQPSHNPNCANAQNSLKTDELPLEWQIGQGMEKITIPDTDTAQRKDAAMLIATGMGVRANDAFELAFAFQDERKITFTNEQVKGQRKAVKFLLEKKITPEHVRQAVRKMADLNFTCTTLFHIQTVADEIANPAPSTKFDPAKRNPLGI